MSASRLSDREAARIVWILFVAGLLIAILMLIRSQVGGDQLNLLARGWLLAAEGKWISYGNPMSTGGKAPVGIEFAKPVMNSVAVSMSMAIARSKRSRSLNSSSCSHTRRLVVYTVPVQ